MNVVSRVFRYRAFADDLLDLPLDVAVTTRRLQSVFESRIPHSVVGDFMSRQRQLIAKLGFAFRPEAHLGAEFRFAGKVASRIVLFSVEIAQRNRFRRLREIVFSDYFFLMNGFLQWSGFARLMRRGIERTCRRL